MGAVHGAMQCLWCQSWVQCRMCAVRAQGKRCIVTGVAARRKTSNCKEVRQGQKQRQEWSCAHTHSSYGLGGCVGRVSLCRVAVTPLECEMCPRWLPDGAPTHACRLPDGRGAAAALQRDAPAAAARRAAARMSRGWG